MSDFRRQTWMFVLLAILALFAGCKGETSPTAPPVTTPGGGSGGTTTGGGGTPPTGATVTLSVSNATPVVPSTSVITATVTVNGQPAPNGTAVEFTTDNGSFCLAVTGCTETNPPQRGVIRTTTNGVATIVLTSSTAVTANVEATVNNVTSRTSIRFVTAPVETPKPDTSAAITGINPTLGRPAGGEIITITGRNFTAPVRVLFDAGNGVVKEGQVVSVTSTEIRVLSPGFDVGIGQQTKVNIIVLNNAGSTSETRVTTTATFTYQSTTLTPVITTASPASGPINGGTRVTLFGEGFQAPVQVFFGAQEAQVISTNFNQIIVLSPAASTTADIGSGPVVGPVDIRVINIASAKSATAPALFRYTPKMQVTAAGPTEGPFTGGTNVTIDGTGFDDPVAVSIGGVAARVIRVSGTQILAITSGVAPASCSDVVGPIVVTNVENGDSATGPGFIYRVPKPIITGVTSSGPITPGSSVNVSVLNANTAFPQLQFGTVGVPVSGGTPNPNGTTTFTATVPTNVQLTTQPCPGGGTTPQATSFDIVFTSPETSCTVTLRNGLTVNPPQTPTLTVVPPTGFTPFAATITQGNPSATPPTPSTVTQPPAQTISIVNTGLAPLIITSVSTSCAQNGTTPNTINVVLPGPQTLNQCDTTQISARYIGSTTANSNQCTVTLNTNAGTRTIQLSGSSQ